MSTDLSSPPAPGPSLSGAQVGSYTLGALRWRLRLADAYQATGPDGSATVFIVHARSRARRAAARPTRAGGPHRPGAPPRKSWRVAGRGQAVDDGAAGVTEPEQLGALVERRSRR